MEEDRPTQLTIHQLRQLYHNGIISQNAYTQACQGGGFQVPWVDWLKVQIIALAVVFLLTGVIFFFAYNWEQMSHVEKLGLIETGLLFFVVMTYYLGLDSNFAQLSLLCASVMVGVFLLVFGQIYQTGADSYQLFLFWSVLILLWVLLSKYTPQWVLLLVLLNVTLLLYGSKNHRFWFYTNNYTLLSLALLNMSFLFLREYAEQKKVLWAMGKINKVIVLILLLWPITWSAIEAIFEITKGNVLLSLLWIITMIAGFYWYKIVRKDSISFSLIVFSVYIVGITFITRTIFKAGGSETGAFLLSAITILGLSTWTALWLKKTIHNIQLHKNDFGDEK